MPQPRVYANPYFLQRGEVKLDGGVTSWTSYVYANVTFPEAGEYSLCYRGTQEGGFKAQTGIVVTGMAGGCMCGGDGV